MKWTPRILALALLIASCVGLIELTIFLARGIPHSAYIPTELIEHLSSQGTLRTLVQLDLEYSPDAILSPRRWTLQRRRIAYVQAQIMDAVRDLPNTEITVQLESIPWLGVQITPESLERLQHHAFVRAIFEDTAGVTG